MSKKLSLSLAAMCVAALTSGVANAATNIGKGTISMNGSISSATCTVAPSATSFTFPALTTTAINAITASNTKIVDLPLTFDFKDCGVLGNTVEFSMTRGAVGPGIAATNAWVGGFSYSGGASTDATKAPIGFRVGNGQGKYFQLDGAVGANNNIDITAVADKSAFSLPATVEVFRPDASLSAAGYTGTYSGSFQYAIAYP